MGKPQITVRIAPSLLMELNQYVEHTGTSKTDVVRETPPCKGGASSDFVITAIAQYLGRGSDVPLSQRVAEVERRITKLEAKVNSDSGS